MSQETQTDQAASAQPTPSQRVGYYRWTICALLFFATTINYIDRQVLAILKPTLADELKWDEVDYGRITMTFQMAYAVGLLLAGRLMDRFGTRKGLAWSVGLWSLAAMAHAGARSVVTFAAARFALGLSEAGNFPAAIKTTAEWHPKKERALATGIFNSGSNVGAVVAPLMVPWLTHAYGWQTTFIVTGAIGFLWLACWLLVYRHPEEHPSLSKAELAYIQSDPVEPTTKIPWLQLFPHRQAWAFAIGKFMTDPIWWFFLFWLPSFLKKNFDVGLTDLSLPLVIMYLAADVGSICGGWLSSSLIKRGWNVNAGRKTAMLTCALCVVPVFYACLTPNKWVAVALISLALAAHQGWSCNIFTLVSDMFPRRAVGSVTGFGGMAGAFGGMILAETAGQTLKRTGMYLPMFIAAACTYLVALLVIHILVPRLEPAKIDVPGEAPTS